MSRLNVLSLFLAALLAAPGRMLLALNPQGPSRKLTFDRGAVVRGDPGSKEMAFVFTGHEFADGGDHIAGVLEKHGVPAGFFFTGDFYRAANKAPLITRLRRDGHYLGAHSDKHLLYCSWENRDTLLVTKDKFASDILRNLDALRAFGIDRNEASCFLPP